MAVLARVEQRPSPDGLSGEERATLDKHFDANAYEINIDGTRIEWGNINEIEVARAARVDGPAGWLMKKLVYMGERYHVGVYFGRGGEAVLTNITLPTAEYVVRTIAYYAQQPIRYTGVEGVAPVVEA